MKVESGTQPYIKLPTVKETRVLVPRVSEKVKEWEQWKGHKDLLRFEEFPSLEKYTGKSGTRAIVICVPSLNKTPLIILLTS